VRAAASTGLAACRLTVRPNSSPLAGRSSRSRRTQRCGKLLNCRRARWGGRCDSGGRHLSRPAPSQPRAAGCRQVQPSAQPAQARSRPARRAPARPGKTSRPAVGAGARRTTDLLPCVVREPAPSNHRNPARAATRRSTSDAAAEALEERGVRGQRAVDPARDLQRSALRVDGPALHAHRHPRLPRVRPHSGKLTPIIGAANSSWAASTCTRGSWCGPATANGSSGYVATRYGHRWRRRCCASTRRAGLADAAASMGGRHHPSAIRPPSRCWSAWRLLVPRPRINLVLYCGSWGRVPRGARPSSPQRDRNGPTPVRPRPGRVRR
jgi:hypothetical protein